MDSRQAKRNHDILARKRARTIKPTISSHVVSCELEEGVGSHHPKVLQTDNVLL